MAAGDSLVTAELSAGGEFVLVESGSGELVSCGFFLGWLLRMRDWIGAP